MRRKKKKEVMLPTDHQAAPPAPDFTTVQDPLLDSDHVTDPAEPPAPTDEVETAPSDQDEQVLALDAAVDKLRELTSQNAASTMDLTIDEIVAEVRMAGGIGDEYVTQTIASIRYTPVLYIIMGSRINDDVIILSQLGASTVTGVWVDALKRLSGSGILPTKLGSERASSLWI
jgi:hypothetical protein